MKVFTQIIATVILLSSSILLTSQTLSPGSIVFSEDFNGGLPATWSLVNNNSNNFQWIWETSYRQGMFSNCENDVTSTTADNGFMLLPMDYYNTPLPASGAVSMDTYLETPSITLPNNTSFTFRFQQFMRFCCNNTNRLEVLYSFDNFITFTAVSARNSGGINVLGQNAEEVTIPVNRSTSQGNSIKFRILAEGSSHYFWMIDDVELVIPYTSAVSVEKMAIENKNVMSLPASRSAIPLSLIEPIHSDFQIQNRGSLAQTNIYVRSSLYLDSNLNGMPVVSLVSQDSTSVPLLGVDSSTRVSVINQNLPNAYGHYRLKNEVVLNGVNQLSNRKAKEIQFSITDSVLSKNTNIQDCFGDVGMYGLRNDIATRFGTVYSMGSRGGKVTSISTYIGSSNFNVGAYLRVELWSYDPTKNSVNQRIGVLLDSSAVDTINANDLTGWHVFSLKNKINLLPDSNYLVVVHQVGGSSQFSSYSAPAYYDNDKVNSQVYESFSYRSLSNSWDSVYTNFYLNLNFGDIAVGTVDLDMNRQEVTVFPNPSLNVFSLKTELKILEVQVRNIKGQLVKQVANSNLNAIDLTHYNSGVYFALVHLENGKVISKKLVKR